MSSALATARFKPDDLDSVDLHDLMENLDAFLTEEKIRAQHRIRTCEALVNDPNLNSLPIREGLSSLLQNAEDDYGTLLHLEKVLQMKHSASASNNRTPIAINNRPASSGFNYGTSLPVTLGLSQYKPSAAARNGLAGRGKTREASPSAVAATAAAKPVKNFDDQEDFVFDVDEDGGADHADEPEVEKDSREEESYDEDDDDDVTGRRRQTSYRDDEENDDFDENAAFPGIVRPRALSFGESHAIARSLPLSVPIHKHPLLSKNDAEDEFSDIADIPTKIAELAKSVHGGGVFGELPSPRLQHNVG